MSIKTHCSPLRLVLVAMVLLTHASSAQAQGVTFNFSGQITHREDLNGFLGNSFALGSTFSGSLAYNPAQASADAYPGDPNQGLYGLTPPATFNMAVTDGTHTFSTDWGQIAVALPAGGGTEGVAYDGALGSFDGVDLSRNFFSRGYELTLSNTNGPFHVLGNDQVPTGVPNLTDFSTRSFTISAVATYRGGPSFVLQGTVTAITSIPEPSTTAGLLLGTMGLAIFKRRSASTERAADR